MRRTLIAAALGACLAGPAAANEYATFTQLHVTPLGAGSDASCATMALLNLPATWQTGDAIVVMLIADPVHNPTRDPLIAALLAEQAGVLELSPSMPAACPDDRPETSRLAPPADPLDLVFGGLLAARREAGGGLVVAIGYGPGGGSVLAAADETAASTRLGPGGPRFAATLAIGDGRARLRLGTAQAAPERSELRLGLLCEALARSGTTQGTASGEACAVDLVASAPSVRATPVALHR
ncbi:hypothetical protein [Neoroseomonas soli]|uniref:Uncharacterized protein n=1 Tax=Neoroseomonas soli TaxID=1081025 RepID=A0A9X9WWJ1_9PROT|nr:hypothetical protein [Neoroseomonas soli]MBR0671520.1 hypothetical protein [Neoroseomonas soli]